MIYTKKFWKATLVRLIRTFLTTILGVWTAGQIITEVEWDQALLAALSATVYIFILCMIQGLPEVDSGVDLPLMNKPELDDNHWEDKDDGDGKEY